MPEGKATEYLNIRTVIKPPSWFNKEVVLNLLLLLNRELSIRKKDERRSRFVGKQQKFTVSLPKAFWNLVLILVELTSNEHIGELSTPRGTRLISGGVSPLSLKFRRGSKRTYVLHSNRWKLSEGLSALILPLMWGGRYLLAKTKQVTVAEVQEVQHERL